MGLSEFNAGGKPAMNKHPIQGRGGGGRNTPSRFMLPKLKITLYAVFTFLPLCKLVWHFVRPLTAQTNMLF